MEKTLSQLKAEIFASPLAPDFEVITRIQATFIRLQEASKNGAKEDRNNFAREIANLTTIKKAIAAQPWRNL